MWRHAALRAGAVSAVTCGGVLEAKLARACGIVGVIGESDDARDVLLDGLSILQNRGYDSAGMATMRRGGGGERDLAVTKYASRSGTSDSIALLRAHSGAHAGHGVGIAHTRWATHGGKTDENAHPHFDCRDRVGVVHNGVITNADALRRSLEDSGVQFRSETDTEVIAQLIGAELASEAAPGLRDATAAALRRCEGTWGVCALDSRDPDSLVVACNGSPMNIGLAPGRTFVASETSAFNTHTKNFIAMQDGEIGVVRAGGTTLDVTRAETAPDLELRRSPAPYAHWMIREISEQPAAIARALCYGGRLGDGQVFLGGMDRRRDEMRGIRHLLLVGCGTSLNAGSYGAKLMRDLHAFDTAQAADASEVGPADVPRAAGGVLALSQSGETKDVLRTIKVAHEADVPSLSVVNVVGSLIARTTRLGVYLNAGRENAVASTKAFTTQVTVLALLTCWFHQLRVAAGAAPTPKFAELMDEIQRLPVAFGMGLRLRDQCKGLAAKLKDKDHLFILGKGYAEPIAREGALKVKECAYLHAEAFSGGAMKHGPFALISEDMDRKTPIIMIILADEHAHLMRTAAAEAAARDAEVYVITDDPSLAAGIDADPIVIPRNGRLTALCAVLPLQFLAYELALLRGVDPDFPRHLAKSVTVD